MQISFIGAGKVGVSLGKYFISKGRKVGGYYSLSPKSAAWAANFTNTKQYQSIEEIISSSDMIFFTVPDDKIGEVWEAAKPYAHGKIIAHCSGIHSSNIFSDIDRTGSMAYSIHPLCAVSDRETSWQALGDVLFTIEGDERNISNIQNMFAQMGNRTCFISAENKIKYPGDIRRTSLYRFFETCLVTVDIGRKITFSDKGIDQRTFLYIRRSRHKSIDQQSGMYGPYRCRGFTVYPVNMIHLWMEPVKFIGKINLCINRCKNDIGNRQSHNIQYGCCFIES